LIDVGTFSGTVTAIGTRCSQLSRADGVEILIPNSVILQSTVVNWTLSDRHARQEMLIGIAYGSPVEQATRTIRDIARAHSGVLKNKNLDVYFHDFGPDSIVLRLLYWIDKGIPDSTNQVPSEIRLAIYNSFNQEGITLAFPQRDVHLDAVGPIAVHLVANPSK
jgi:small-conductance mechanosensitive channel